MKELPDVLEIVKTAFQIVVLFLAIAAILTGEKTRMRNAQDLATIVSLVAQRNATPDYIPVKETTQDDETKE